MGENNEKMQGNVSNNMEEILREREKLDQIIQKKFKKEVSILFSDICGYTEYVDARGDISGRALIQRHNDIVFSCTEANNGTIIKTIGDAVMASFPSTLDSVTASIGIQEDISQHNKAREQGDEIHVKIGINCGKALLDGGDVIGDVVNVASRIQGKADKDQILISENVYENIRTSEDTVCRYHERVSIKGKPEPLKLYKLIWRDEELSATTEPKVQAYEYALRSGVRAEKKPAKVLYLEASREGDNIKIGAHESMTGEQSTIRHYGEMSVSMDRIQNRCRGIIEILNSANRKGRIRSEILANLRETGQVFYDELLTPDTKTKVKETDAEYLILNLDDQLVQIPWELLHDGNDFLCQRFNMGRLVKTRQQTWATKQRKLERPLKMLVLADPKGNLKGAYDEGRKITDAMDNKTEFINVSFRADNISVDYIHEKIRNFDIVHFAGHAEYESEKPGEGGWLLSDGKLTAQAVMKMSGGAPMPALIFSNACQSARTQEWVLKDHFQNEIFGLANAFLLSGAKHYIGTFWEILDEPSSLFSLEFYRYLMDGASLGEAMRLSRRKLIEMYGEQTIVWGSYVLYGDPTFSYIEYVQEKETLEEKPKKVVVQGAETGTRALEDDITFGKDERKKAPKALWSAVAAAVILAIALWVYPGFLKKGTSEYERSAITLYQQGNYPGAMEVCEKLREQNPELRLTYVILGNIRFIRGDFKEAGSYFQKALKSGKGTDEQKAAALMGLGRIASIEKKNDQALKYFEQAARLAPGSGQAYMSQAILLDRQGKYDEALGLFTKAKGLLPEDRGIMVMADETSKRASLLRDREKRERIDKLIEELLANHEKAVTPTPSDGWTSLPLTLWIMDFETKGYGLQEARERLIASGIMQQLIEKSRAQVVERSILDRLLEELKLGTSKLVDRATALSVGKILAARLILSGQVLNAGPQTLVSVRIIETETGEVKTAVNEAFGSVVPTSIIAEKLSGILLAKLKSLYPLQGKISEIKGDEITLNIGQNQGVKAGQQFKVKDTDLVLEITGVETDFSAAKLMGGTEDIQTGLRVEMLVAGF